jgi:hypothetical protein
VVTHPGLQEIGFDPMCFDQISLAVSAMREYTVNAGANISFLNNRNTRPPLLTQTE